MAPIQNGSRPRKNDGGRAEMRERDAAAAIIVHDTNGASRLVNRRNKAQHSASSASRLHISHQRSAKGRTACSRKRAIDCLRASSLVLVLLYVYSTWRLQRIHRDNIHATSNSTLWDDFLGASPAANESNVSPVPSQASATSACGDCASNILWSYILASCIWNATIHISKRGRKHCLPVGAALVAVILLRHLLSEGSDDAPSQNGSTWQHIIATTGDATSWNGNAVRISFTLHSPDDVPYPDAFSKKNYRCDGRPPLPPSLAGRTVLNFTTSIRTDLKIVFVGDSIGAQFAQAYEFATLGKGNEAKRWAQGYQYRPDKDWTSECLSITPGRGGGVGAFWRMTGLMARENKRSSYYHCDRDHHNDKGWSESQAVTLLDLIDNDPSRERVGVFEGRLDSPPQAGAFDAFVMRVPHGWLSVDQITREGIVEEIELIVEYLGTRTIVISTLPVCNNVVTREDWEKVGKINAMIRDIAQNWPEGQIVLVQEFGDFTNQAVYSNAKDIGLHNGTLPDFSQKGWEQHGTLMYERLAKKQSKWPPSKAQVCANTKFWIQENGDEECELNRISVDGSHWCVNSLGPRHSASLACLLGCVYNGDGDVGGNGNQIEDIRACERECNSRFMSVLPVEEEWIGMGTAIFATN